MSNENKGCWACGKNTMRPDTKLGHGWVKCSKCGATNQTNPTQLRQSDFIRETIDKGLYDKEKVLRPRQKPKTRARTKA